MHFDPWHLSAGIPKARSKSCDDPEKKVVKLLEHFGPTVGILVLGTVVLAFGDDCFEQNRSWDDFGTTTSGI